MLSRGGPWNASHRILRHLGRLIALWHTYSIRYRIDVSERAERYQSCCTLESRNTIMPLIRKRRAVGRCNTTLSRAFETNTLNQAEEADEVDADAETPTQRRRRSSPEDEDVDYFQAAAEADSSTKQMVKNLVRLALASEYSRTPIRRTEINARGVACVANKSVSFHMLTWHV